VTLADAQRRAQDIAEAIRPYCRQVEIVGDVRRELPEVHALALVAVPVTNDAEKLCALRDLVNTRWGKPEHPFPMLVTEIRGELPVTIYWPTQQMFGWMVFERSGSNDFVARAVQRWERISGGGYLREGQMCLPNDDAIETPAEADVFAALQWRFIAPVERTKKARVSRAPHPKAAPGIQHPARI
jgi:DNA polymerase/3'-5' exonuclease PolX